VLVPFEVVTSTLPVPTLFAAVRQAIVVEVTTATSVAETPLILTVAPRMKFLPVIVTGRLPPVVPELGEMALTVGRWMAARE
jgi:hypothetical protein